MKNFEIEQKVLACSNVCDDLRILKKMMKEDEGRAELFVQILHDYYQEKFHDLYETLQEQVDEV